jgi:hypothetical protein
MSSFYTCSSTLPFNHTKSSTSHIIHHWTIPTEYHPISGLGLNGTPLHLLPAIPLTLLLEVLALLFGTQSAELGVTLLPLELVSRNLPLLGLLFLIDLADLGDLLVARLLDAAEGFRAEVGRRGEVVGETKEVLEDGEGGGVV